MRTYTEFRHCLKCESGSVKFEVNMGEEQPAYETIRATCFPCGTEHLITLKRNSETNVGLDFALAPGAKDAT